MGIMQEEIEHIQAEFGTVFVDVEGSSTKVTAMVLADLITLFTVLGYQRGVPESKLKMIANELIEESIIGMIEDDYVKSTTQIPEL